MTRCNFHFVLSQGRKINAFDKSLKDFYYGKIRSILKIDFLLPLSNIFATLEECLDKM